jgi:hypothetical protein
LRLKRPQFVGLGGDFCGGINLKYSTLQKNTDRSSVYVQEKIKNKNFRDKNEIVLKWKKKDHWAKKRTPYKEIKSNNSVADLFKW